MFTWLLPRNGLHNPVYYESAALAKDVVSRPLPSNGSTHYILIIVREI
jgi:hypothetical protein